MKSNVRARCEKVVKYVFLIDDTEPIKDTVNFETDLWGNELNMHDLMWDIEEEFRIEVTPEEEHATHTFGDLVKLVESKL